MVRISFETKKKKILSTLTQFRSNITTSTFATVLLTIFNLFPLFYITHQWKIQDTGLLSYLKHTLITTLINDLDTITILLFSIILGLTLMTCVYIYYIYSVKGVNAFYRFIHPTMRVLYYTHFIYVQYIFEIIFSFAFKDVCPDSGCGNFSAVKLFMAMVAILLTFAINTTLNLILRKPHFIQLYLFVGKLNSLNLQYSILPMLQGILVLENYIPFEYFLIIKLIVRGFYFLYYLKYIYNYYTIINNTELIIKTMCFISVVGEFVFIKDFFSFDVTLFQQNPAGVSLLLDNDFINRKLLAELILSFIFYFILQKRVYRKDPTCFYLTKRNDYIFFTFYNKLFRFLLSIKKNKIEVVQLYNQILNHKKKCEFEECYCHGLISQYHKLLERNNINKSAEQKTKELYDLMLKKIDEILQSLIDKTNDPYDTFQVLFVYILFSIYFGKHYIQSFFTIQKIEKSSIYKDNFIIRLQISFIKHELVSDFITHNHQIANEDYNVMHGSYKEYSRYMKIEDSIIYTIEKYKVLSKSVLNKQLNSEEYNKYIRKFYKALDRSYKLIDKNIKFHSQNVSNIKLLYFLKFFDYDRYIYHKDDQYFKVHYDATARLNLPDVMIIKHTKSNNDFIIEYITPIYCENLGYISTDLLGREVHELMPDGFREQHFNHMQAYISNNNMTVKNKEVFFIDCNGFINMHKISGSVMLTLKQELYIYIELVSLRNVYDFKGICYVCLSSEGLMMNINKSFEDYFVYKQVLAKTIRTNFFTDVLGIRKEEMDSKLEGEVYQFEIRYGDLMEKFQKLDYSKLWDSDNVFYTTYMENLMNFRFKVNAKIVIKIERRNFMRRFYFYVVKLSIQEATKFITPKANLFHITRGSLSKDDVKFQNEQKAAKNIFARIKYSAYQVLKKDKPIELDIAINEPIYQHQIIKTSVKDKEFTCCSLTFVLFVLVTFISGTIMLEYFKVQNFKYADILSSLNIRMYNIDIYTSYLRSSDINIFINSDIERNKKFIDKLLDKYRLMIKEIVIDYFTLSSDLGARYSSVYNHQVEVTELNLDFSKYNRNMILFDALDDYKSHSYRIISGNGFNIDIENYPKLTNSKVQEAKYEDKAVLYAIENDEIDTFLHTFYDINVATSNELIQTIKSFITSINFILITLLFVAILYSINEYLGDQSQVYNRLFIVFNVIKYHNIYLLSKIVIFEDLFKDFTIKNKDRLQDLNIGQKDLKELKTHLSDFMEKNNDKLRETNNELSKLNRIESTTRVKDPLDTLKDHFRDKVVENNKTDLSSHARTQSVFLRTKEAPVQKYLIHSEMLKKSKRHYLFFTFYLLLSFFTILASVVITIIILVHIDLISKNVTNTFIYFNKNKIINEMILTYQISMIKRDALETDATEHFTGLKNKYYEYKTKLDSLKTAGEFTIDDVNQFELELTNNDLCQVIANRTTFPESDCIAIGNGINTKGYSNMIDTMYQVLFFLYNDLSYQIKNGVRYKISDITKSMDYNRIMTNYQTILFEIHNIIISLLFEDKNYSLNFVKSWEDILICCLGLETMIILMFYTIFYRSADNRIKILNKVEKIVENTIFCTI
jgi:hypothetical protein